MRAPNILQSLFFVLTGVFMGCSEPKTAEPQAAAPATGPTVASSAERITGPYTHANLAVYLIHGPDKAAAKYLTLAEALDQKKAIVHETGSVNQLSIENVSDDAIYIQSGEIVKGGQQDRTIATDMVVTRSMGNTPISSFCVEHGRWTGRGTETATLFSSSHDYVAGKEMKLASNSNSGYSDQSRTWASVARAQKQLSENAGESVAASASPSSFQLTMESKALTDRTNEYLKALSPAIDGQDDVIGWAYAVNGKIVGGNEYASRELFRKLWPKLIKSGCVEAFADLKKDSPTTQPSPSIVAVQQFLADAAKPKPVSKDINARTCVSNYECPDSILLECGDKESGDWIHRNYMTKEAAPAK